MNKDFLMENNVKHSMLKFNLFNLCYHYAAIYAEDMQIFGDFSVEAATGKGAFRALWQLIENSCLEDEYQEWKRLYKPEVTK